MPIERLSYRYSDDVRHSKYTQQQLSLHPLDYILYIFVYIYALQVLTVSSSYKLYYLMNRYTFFIHSSGLNIFTIGRCVHVGPLLM